MYDQEMFNKIVTHLRKQNAKSLQKVNYSSTNLTILGNELRCAYRGDEGRKCAIGCIIEDDEYSISMERHNVDSLLSGMEGVCFPGIIKQSLKDKIQPNLRMLRRMQSIHDSSEVENWEYLFEETAADFHLNLPGKK